MRYFLLFIFIVFSTPSFANDAFDFPDQIDLVLERQSLGDKFPKLQANTLLNLIDHRRNLEILQTNEFGRVK